jgi:hypothetical protein
MRTVCIYSGRFQPFGLHHFASYNHLVSKFGIENVYIVSGNKVGERSPLSFGERKRIIEKYGVPSEMIVSVVSPYRCEEVIDGLSDDVVVVFAVGSKDSGRLNSKYYGVYGSYMKSRKECHYIYEIPHQEIDIDGVELCGTEIRRLFSVNNKNKKESMQSVMGFFDEKIYDIISKKCLTN